MRNPIPTRPLYLKSRLEQITLSLYFTTIPFMWCYIGIIAVVSIRLSDVFLLAIILLALRRRNHPNTVFQQQVILLFLGLCLALSISIVANLYPKGILTIIKILFYLLGALAAVSLLAKNGFMVSFRLYIATIIALLLYIVIFQPVFFTLIFDTIHNFTKNPVNFGFHLWSIVFDINLFGPNFGLDRKGVSFRNTTGVGFFSLGLFTYGMVERTRLSSVLVLVFIFISIMTFSRSAIILSLSFLLGWVLFVGTKKTKITLGLVLVLFTILLLHTFLADSFAARLQSNLGRSGLFLEGIAKFLEAPFLGHGADYAISYEHKNNVKVHNVPLALGVEFGALALFFSTALILLFFYTALIASLRLFDQNLEMKGQVLIISIGAVCLFLRPLVSASSEVFFARPEWAILSIILLAHTKVRQETECENL